MQSTDETFVMTYSFDATKEIERIREIEWRPLKIVVHHLCKVIKIWTRWGTHYSDVVFERFDGFAVQIIFEESSKIFARIFSVVTIQVDSYHEVLSYKTYFYASMIMILDI